MGDTLVKKLTVKTLKVTDRPVKGGPQIHVGRIVGECDGRTRQVTTQYGVTHEFSGQFAGISLVPVTKVDTATGEIKRVGTEELKVKSHKLFVPAVFEPLLIQAIGDGTKPVQFGIDVFIEHRSVGGNDGFEYSVKSLYESTQESPLERMLKALPALPGTSVPALAAPAPESAPAPTTEKETAPAAEPEPEPAPAAEPEPEPASQTGLKSKRR